MTTSTLASRNGTHTNGTHATADFEVPAHRSLDQSADDHGRTGECTLISPSLCLIPIDRFRSPSKRQFCRPLDVIVCLIVDTHEEIVTQPVDFLIS